VNGERVEGPRLLRTGDEIQVGGTVFVVELVDASPNGQPAPQAEPVVPREAPTHMALRLELDLDAGQLTVTFENGPTARIVRDGDGWRVETP
jgi:pSer/pThr/pTyr-binding forkhead associated (FHA) protein